MFSSDEEGKEKIEERLKETQKVFGYVFDKFTILNIYKLFTSGTIGKFEFPIASGKEIRYREIGHTSKAVGNVELRITNYFASGGLEKFLEFVDERDKIIAFLRLRVPGENVERPELIGKTLIREIKTFGKEARIDQKGEYQHRGYGRRLLNEAEEITREIGYDGIAVISGIGAREYFRRNGYERTGPYMSKRTELI